MSESLRQMWDYLGSDAAWSGRNGLPALTWAHIRVSLVAILIAAAIAIPTGVLLGHVRRGAFVAVSVVNIGRAIPSFAILALLLPLSLRYGFGLGFWPTIVALVLLAIPPIFTNTYTGVRDVPDEAVEAARGMGMRGRRAGAEGRGAGGDPADPDRPAGVVRPGRGDRHPRGPGRLPRPRHPDRQRVHQPGQGPACWRGPSPSPCWRSSPTPSLAWAERRLVPWRRMARRAEDVTLAADELDGAVPAGASG